MNYLSMSDYCREATHVSLLPNLTRQDYDYGDQEKTANAFEDKLDVNFVPSPGTHIFTYKGTILHFLRINSQKTEKKQIIRSFILAAI